MFSSMDVRQESCSQDPTASASHLLNVTLQAESAIAKAARQWCAGRGIVLCSSGALLINSPDLVLA